MHLHCGTGCLNTRSRYESTREPDSEILAKVAHVGERVTTGFGRRDDPEGDPVEVTR